MYNLIAHVPHMKLLDVIRPLLLEPLIKPQVSFLFWWSSYVIVLGQWSESFISIFNFFFFSINLYDMIFDISMKIWDTCLLCLYYLYLDNEKHIRNFSEAGANCCGYWHSLCMTVFMKLLSSLSEMHLALIPTPHLSTGVCCTIGNYRASCGHQL